VRDNSVYEVVEQRPLTEAAREARVLSDMIVQLGREPEDRPQHPVRLVLVLTTPHEKRGKTGGGTLGPITDGVVRIATNLLDVPAEVIGFIYQSRWMIEIFFRFLKHILGCRHLLSTDPVGVEIQAYCAIIACLLIALWTGKQPTKRTYEMLCFYFIGWADDEELLQHLQKRKAQEDQSASSACGCRRVRCCASLPVWQPGSSPTPSPSANSPMQSTTLLPGSTLGATIVPNRIGTCHFS